VSEALARSEAARLKAAMERHGVRCSIELQIGRPNRTGWGDDWYTRKVAPCQHHTAGATTGNTPSLVLVKRGRGTPGTTGYLPGPLSNGYGGRDHVYRIITMGLANHPGKGGPLVVPKIGGGSYRIPKDSARHLAWGTEWEHDGVSPWPADMQEFMGRAGAALAEWAEWPRGTSFEHKTWAPGRKTDRNAYTAASGDAEIQRWHSAGITPPRPPAGPTPEQAAHDAAAAAAAQLANQEEDDTMRVVIEADPIPPGMKERPKGSFARWWLVGACAVPIYIPNTSIGHEWADAAGQREFKFVSRGAMAPLLANQVVTDLATLKAAVTKVQGGLLTAEQVDSIVDQSLLDYHQLPSTVVDHTTT
jgi:hypothetical protein